MHQALTCAITIAKVARFLDGCEFQDYLNETGCWAKQKEKTDATPPVPGAPRDAVEVGRGQRMLVWRVPTI